jgi:hypothetical protein
MLSQRSPIPIPPPIPYAPTPPFRPWRSPVLGHLKLASPMGLSLQWWSTRPSFDAYAARDKSSGVLVSSYCCSTYWSFLPSDGLACVKLTWNYLACQIWIIPIWDSSAFQPTVNDRYYNKNYTSFSFVRQMLLFISTFSKFENTRSIFRSRISQYYVQDWVGATGCILPAPFYTTIF